MERSNLSDAEFKTLVIRMLKELSEDLSSIKKTQSETKDSLTEIKNNLQGNNNAVNEAKNQIDDLEHEEAKNKNTNKQKTNNQKSKKKKESPQNEDSVSTLWDNFKRSNICIIGRRKSKKLEIYLKK